MAYYSITVVSCQLLMFHVKHLMFHVKRRRRTHSNQGASLSRPATPYYKLSVDLCQAFSSIYFLTTDNGQAPEAQAYPAPPPHIVNYFLLSVKHFLAFYFEKLSIVRCSLYHQQRLTAHNQRTLSAVRL